MNIIYQQRKSKFIHQFEHQTNDIICPTFHVFSWAHRCSFKPKCSYCYLNLTLRYEQDPIVYQSDKVIDEVKDWLSKTEQASVLNAGELSDAFMILNNQLLADVMNLFENQNKHVLLFLSKNDKLPKEIEDNVYNQQYKQTIFSFSVNSAQIASLYESGAPNPYERIALAYRLKKNGQRIRIRIDPIILTGDYQAPYKTLIDILNDFLKPERITLGSLRFFKNLPNFAQDKDVFKYGIDHNDGDGRLRTPLEKRVEAYWWFIDNLQCSEIGLCKETISCHDMLNFRKDLKCNCTL